jgi:hypothetical protein
MKNRSASIAALLFALLIVSCSAPEQRETITCFDFKGFMEHELYMLTLRDDSVKRELTWDRKTESQTILSDSMNWNKELGWFLELDLNKPAYRGAYVQNVTLDKGEQKDITYTLAPGIRRKPPVIRARYWESKGEITMIGGTILKEDLLNRSSITMEYYPRRKYKIEGRQYIFPNIEHRFILRGSFTSPPW